MHEQWTMPPFKVTLRKLVADNSDVYELIRGSDRFGHEVMGSIALIQGKDAALKRFEAEKKLVMTEVAKIALRRA